MYSMKKSNIKIAGIQFTGTTNIKENLDIIFDYIDTAIKNNIDLIVLPEIANIVQMDKSLLKKAINNDSSDFLSKLQNKAKHYNVAIHIGSMVVKDGKKFANRSYVINKQGKIISTYDKIHMFDVNLENNESYKESDYYNNGSEISIADFNKFKYGLSICYDIRFPMLFQELSLRGADIIAIPSCFTHTTGIAHWEILARARAIETGSFIIAIGQTGLHQDGRKTYGHSIVVNPWGEVIAKMGEEQGILYANINLVEVETVRNQIPKLKSITDFK